MEPNFNCSICKEAAQYYCMCLPEKVYICASCIPTHLYKGGAHPFAPLSAPLTTLVDMKVYNQKLQLAQKFSGTLEMLSSKLVYEHSQLMTTLEQCCSQQVNELYSVYTQAASDLDRVYRGISYAIEASKQEIGLWGQARVVDFSSDTLSFFDAVHSVQSETSGFLNVTGEMKRRVSLTLQVTELPIQDYLKSVLSSWELPKCECSECQLLNVLLGRKTELNQLQTPASDPVPGCWTCTFCGCQLNREARRFCQQPSCNKERALLGATWKCINCSEENVRSSEECKKCHVRKGWASYLEHKGVELNPERTMWKCSKCSQYVDISTFQCCFCDHVLPVDSSLADGDQKPTFWDKMKSFIH